MADIKIAYTLQLTCNSIKLQTKYYIISFHSKKIVVRTYERRRVVTSTASAFDDSDQILKSYPSVVAGKSLTIIYLVSDVIFPTICKQAVAK